MGASPSARTGIAREFFVERVFGMARSRQLTGTQARSCMPVRVQSQSNSR
jgi:hypothetical protein